MARRIELGEADYPASLLELLDPPQAIYLQGALPSLERAVAIVGTRRVDAGGMRFARDLARDLAKAGCSIVSGGAHGIDTAAHEGALDAGGATVAVLPSSLDEPYPPRNRGLFDSIAQTGGLLSEFDLDPPRFKSLFLARNRLIAALARITIVVQAPIPSGALSTSTHARLLGRPVLAVPHAPWDVRGTGCLGLLASGAGLCRGSADVLAVIAPEALSPRVRTRAVRGDLDEDELAVLEALGLAPTVDALCAHTALGAARVQRAILMLLLAGEIEEVGAGRYVTVER